MADLTRYVILRDDFIGGDVVGDDTATALGELGWVVTDVAGAANSDVTAHATAADIKGHPGVIALFTGPTTPAAADEASLFLGNVDSIVLNDATDTVGDNREYVYAAAIVRFPSIVEFEFYFGLFDSASAAGRGVNSISCELDISADAEFNLVVVDGSAAASVASTVTAAADTWYLIELLAHEDECQMWINRDPATAVRIVDVDIPDDTPMGPGFKVTTEGTDEKSVLIDAFMLRVPVDRV